MPQEAAISNVFPTLPGQGVAIGRRAIWSSRVQTGTSGKETRIGYWSYPIWEYTVSFEVLRTRGALVELAQLLGFFNLVGGSRDEFLYTDPNDNAVTGQPIATGDGTTTRFLLVRSLGGTPEPVRAITAATVYLNGASPTGITIDSQGYFTLGTAPAAGVAITWTGAFQWRCRFVEDYIDSNTMMQGLADVQSLKFRTLK